MCVSGGVCGGRGALAPRCVLTVEGSLSFWGMQQRIYMCVCQCVNRLTHRRLNCVWGWDRANHYRVHCFVFFLVLFEGLGPVLWAYVKPFVTRHTKKCYTYTIWLFPPSPPSQNSPPQPGCLLPVCPPPLFPPEIRLPCPLQSVYLIYSVFCTRSCVQQPVSRGILVRAHKQTWSQVVWRRPFWIPPPLVLQQLLCWPV